MKKTGRNDPCPCKSGKKFKKCCESKMIGGRFMATRVDQKSSDQIQKTVNLTSFFQARLAETPKKPEGQAPVETVHLQQSLPEKEKIC